MYTYITYTHTQTLYGCNFDTATSGNTCFGGVIPLSLSTGIGRAGSTAPIAPLSDVTSSRKKSYRFHSFIICHSLLLVKLTLNGEICNIPYKLNPYTWDMYFCNNGYCQTQTNQNTSCSPG